MMGQNLVQNGGFETNTGLPTSVAQWNLASNWSNANSSSASPDYLHTGGTGMVQLPNSIFGTIPPYQGNAVMGLAMWHGTSSNFREYVSQQLSAPLIVGNSYTFSFYISNGIPGSYGGVGIKNVQVDFSVNPINQIGSSPLGYNPLLSSSTIIYSNTWIPVSFTFVATSPYAYFAIGNFKDDANTVTQTGNTTPHPSAYYFIDEVSLVVGNNTPVSITGNQNICPGNSTVLTGMGASTYTWLPGNITTNSISVTPTVTTTYTLLTGAGSSTASTAAIVTVNSAPSISVTSNGILNCTTNTIALNSSLSSGVTYTWSGPGFNGSVNGQNAVATAAGSYTLKVTDAVSGCTNTAMTTVIQNTVIPSPTASAAGSLSCSTTTVALNGTPSSGVTYTWSGPGFNGSVNGQNAVATAAGSYTLKVTDVVSGCTNIATTTVTQITTTLSPAISTGTLTCATTTIALNGTPSSGVTYTWSGPGIISGVNTSSPIINLPGTYSMTVAEVNGCSATVTTTVLQNSVAPVVTINHPFTCGTPTVQLSATTSTNTISYNWFAPATGALNNSGISNPIISGSGVFTVVVTNTVNGCVASETATLSATPVALSVSVNNATICSGTNAILTATGNVTSYSWSPAGNFSPSTGPSVTASPNATSIYTVTGITGACSVAVEFTVTVLPTPVISITSSTISVCAGSSATLQAAGATSYIWSPAGSLSSSTGSVVSANPGVTTTYSVTGTNGNQNLCAGSRSLLIIVIPNVVGAVSPSIEICEGGSTMLSAMGGNVKWMPSTWLSNSNAPTTKASPLVSTTYTALISNNGSCPDSKTVDVFVNPKPAVYAGRDTTIIFGDSLLLAGTGDGTLTWISGDFLTCNHCSNTSIIPGDNSCYVIEAITSKGCTNFDEVCVKVDKQSAFYIPNTFTPNGDETNDIFNVVGFGITEIELSIFNRWGTLIYTTNELSKGWDGKSKGVLCENGVYIYQVTVKTISMETKEKVGHVTLLGK